MKALLVGVALLALTVPAAYAQSGSQEVPPPEMEGPGQYRVFFAFDRANLTDADRQMIIQAVDDYHRTGTAQITATGHTDTSGSAAYNLELSQRRAEAVASELIRQGVPATDIVTIGRGEEDLLVPTADGVREPRNRRVEIVIPQPPPAAAPAPVAEAPAPPPEPAAEEPDRFTFALGPVRWKAYLASSPQAASGPASPPTPSMSTGRSSARRATAASSACTSLPSRVDAGHLRGGGHHGAHPPGDEGEAGCDRAPVPESIAATQRVHLGRPPLPQLKAADMDLLKIAR